MSMLKSAIKAFPNAIPPNESGLDVIAELAKLRRVEHFQTGTIKIRNMGDLAKVQDAARKRIVGHWQKIGVHFIDPALAFIGPRVKLSNKGVAIEPMARIEGRAIVGDGTTIGQGSIIVDSAIGPNVEIRPYSVIKDSIIGEGAKIGPFAHLREGSQIDSRAHIGNFVETKKTHMRIGSKANHLSYLGDCEVGEETNIGAGCITCNYDGSAKHRTVIGRYAFIGSGSQLVAPIEVGAGAVLGAGTTLTADAPDGALVLTRPETVVKEGGGIRLREKRKRASDAK
jgi:bifunctional UDP-N-acetylglucosamine pyrophosphorylase/glucosamine-1-phosphate N-acetyltransferase